MASVAHSHNNNGGNATDHIGQINVMGSHDKAAPTARNKILFIHSETSATVFDDNST